MAESKIAMSRALGAAFLSHQVEQLEKSVSNGASSGNWRDRKYTNTYSPTNSNRKPINPPNKPVSGARKKVGDSGVPKERDSTRTPEVAIGRKSAEKPDKDADVIVVDASLLVHSLNQLKKWSKAGRQEVVIVPLEALNTLDLLKKGSSSLAQKARAASRILEAQVGTNTRIRVQHDDAFVLWDKIKFSDDKLAAQNSPEWIRRTICCARWEADNSDKTAPGVSNPKVILAVCDLSSGSPQTSTVKLAQEHDNTLLSPVPGPAPSHHNHPNKHEPRSAGVQVAAWAAKAGVEVVKFEPSGPQSPNGHARSSSDEDRPKRIPNKGPARRGGGPSSGKLEGDKLRGGLVERSPAVLAMMEMVKRPDTKPVRVLARGEKLDP